MVSHARGVFEVARVLAGEIERRLARGELGGLAILATRHVPGEPAAIEHRTLVPLPAPTARWPGELPPLHHLAPDELLARIVGEYVAGELARTLMESFASESAARLQAMEAARRHIEDRLRELHDEANRLRQEEITAELLDVITGAEAVRHEEDERP
jgi:F-type H+-transporting ATPase subunit gamma